MSTARKALGASGARPRPFSADVEVSPFFGLELNVFTTLFRGLDLIEDIRRKSRDVRDSFFSSGNGL